MTTAWNTRNVVSSWARPQRSRSVTKARPWQPLPFRERPCRSPQAGIGGSIKANIKRVMGIEPTYLAWKASVLPLNYTRKVGVTGFEPATSWSQIKRSSQAEPHPGILLCLSSLSDASVIIGYNPHNVNTFFKIFLKSFKQPENPLKCEGLVRMFLRFRFCGIVCCVLYRFPFPQSDLWVVEYSDMVIDNFNFL